MNFGFIFIYVDFLKAFCYIEAIKSCLLPFLSNLYCTSVKQPSIWLWISLKKKIIIIIITIIQIILLLIIIFFKKKLNNIILFVKNLNFTIIKIKG